jgi:ribose/xylose/arabinose/galactoside ABC-type transport system permease subunit
VWVILPPSPGVPLRPLNGALFAYGKIPSFIVTLGTLVIFRGIVLLYTKGARSRSSDPGFLALYAGAASACPTPSSSPCREPPSPP